MTAHSGDATTLDWHPLVPDIVATGGASDRSVKIWDLETYLSMNHTKEDGFWYNMNANANTMTSQTSQGSSGGDTDRSTYVFRRRLDLKALTRLRRSIHSHFLCCGSPPLVGFQTRSFSSSPATSTLNTSRHKSSSPKNLLHVLATLASVTRLRWRPPAYESFPLESDDRHGAMLAVATAPVKGASAGGAGLLALWSYHRPFMPLSVVQGHKDGAVTDFDWLDTPLRDARQKVSHSIRGSGGQHSQNIITDSSERSRLAIGGSGFYGNDTGLYDHNEAENTYKPVGIWQHVLSVGRDGRCLIQSFVRGEMRCALYLPMNFCID